MPSVDAFAYFLLFAKITMLLVGLCFLISGLDDLFIDICYACRNLYRRLVILPKCNALSEQRLREKEEQWIAIMVPAWDESAVIRPMLENTLRVLDYTNYRIFIGTYPNDLETQREVDLVREGNIQVHRITTPHDGPTNKADCLNWIYQGIHLYEKSHGMKFEIFVMQDCEDVIHPLCYRLFNYLIPRKDMVQLPVQSLETKWYQLTGGHYMDEFAQSHYKDMVVREAISGCIPAAGVGCGFSRKAFETIAGKNNNQLFSIDSLTEDYDFGFRLHRNGLKQVFVRYEVVRSVQKKQFLTGKITNVTKRETVCIREYFPAKFMYAVRQKSRWVVGITMQGWENLGWQGSLATRYMLFRDRKSILTNLLNLVGYLLVGLVLTVWFIQWLHPDTYKYPPLLEKNSLLWYVLYVNAFLLLLRILLRAYCVYRLHGTMHAFLSFPRMIWGNLINFLATMRAIKQYVRYLRTGKLIKWDKTTHQYPSEEQLLSFRRKLGDILLDSRRITVDQLNHALKIQCEKPALLGEILKSLGWLQQHELDEFLLRQ
ncbi:glycosyl transferase family protein [Noviherbaspirillum suwonense]|uniref:Adsorption protein B n=1 Tax=Noviherbaspirillum suwonense TaxID=1224511 RepID=A0ABY1QJU6_9BURK|nr:glycosyl transferase family protein [Noviherbaspirillum suwonense]SMP71700.1 adsorption protein B [Noviherbaspirillum suwonense]